VVFEVPNPEAIQIRTMRGKSITGLESQRVLIANCRLPIADCDFQLEIGLI